MKKEYQVTIFDTNKKYRPISAIVTREQNSDTDLSIYSAEIRSELAQAGVQKICNKKYWTKADLKKYGYSKIKVRLYEK